MTEQRRSGRPEQESNPFATRFIRPGSLEYLFATGKSYGALINRLADRGWRGEIVGPHGSGKSTLLRGLIPELTALGIHVTLFTLRQGNRSLPKEDSEDVEWFPPAEVARPDFVTVSRIWIIDGAERLSRFELWRLKGVCWWVNRGLVATSHRSLGFPLLVRTVTSPDLVWQLVQKLLPPDSQFITRNDVAEAFDKHQGNVRELMLGLFDTYRERIRRDPGEI